jgi:hypothetical protein
LFQQPAPVPVCHTQTQATPGPSRIPVDPALVPLPPAGINELQREHSGTPMPVSKKAGSRHSVKADPKGKGKARSSFNPEGKRKQDEAEELVEKGKRGHSKGSANYKDDEVQLLLDLAEAELPTGAKGWQQIGVEHRKWCRLHIRPQRTDRSLELKYKQVRAFRKNYFINSNCHDSF